MKKSNFLLNDSLWALGSGFGLGALFSVFSAGSFWLGWLKCGLLSALLCLGVIRVWRLVGAGRTLAMLMLVTFAVRIALGIFLNQGLPVFGFDNPVQKSGYVFSDAHDRDQAAYKIAVSGKTWLPQIKSAVAADQYGGLLALSTLVYWVFSADVQRPLLMVLISAAAMAAGLAFLYASISRKWGTRIALVAAWIYALYPDSVMLGSSQMREPILIALTCLLFWSILDWKIKPVRTLIVALIITAVTGLFSIPAAGAAAIVVFGIVFFEWLDDQAKQITRRIAIGLFVVFLGLVGIAGWYWLKSSLSYEFSMTVAGSGWISALLTQLGEKYRLPMITFYGLTQPLLPAALVDSSIPIWKGIAIFRAAGWFFIIPFLIYALFSSFQSIKDENRSVLIFLSLALAAWILISSLRGGGDQWDNPRYRTTFLPWISILVGWVWVRISKGKTPWFWRILVIEGIFLLVFLDWYLYRDFNWGPAIAYYKLLLFIVISTLIILIGGFVWDKIITGKQHR